MCVSRRRREERWNGRSSLGSRLIVSLSVRIAIGMPSVRSVLLFRSKSDESSQEDVYEKLLHDQGYRVKTISPIQFHFINQDALSTRLKTDDFYALIFTSKRAVEAVQRLLPDEDRQRWKRVYVEGPATGALVREVFGGTVDILGAETGGGESLAEFIVQEVQRVEGPVRLFFPCAQGRLDALPKRMSNQQGIQFEEMIVYETIPSESLAQELDEYLQTQGKPDVLGFFSPSGFESVFNASERIRFNLTAPKTVLISLGKTTSTAIRTRLQSISSSSSSSFDERSCLKPNAEEFLRLVKSIEL